MHQPGSLSSSNSPAHGASLSNNSLAPGVLRLLPRHNLAHGALRLLPRRNLAHGVLLRSNLIVGEPRIPHSSNKLVVGAALLSSSQPADGTLKPLVSRPAAGVRQRSHSRRTPGAIPRLTRHQPAQTRGATRIPGTPPSRHNSLLHLRKMHGASRKPRQRQCSKVLLHGGHNLSHNKHRQRMAAVQVNRGASLINLLPRRIPGASLPDNRQPLHRQAGGNLPSNLQDLRVVPISVRLRGNRDQLRDRVLVAHRVALRHRAVLAPSAVTTIRRCFARTIR
jgi:hypothetical protein